MSEKKSNEVIDQIGYAYNHFKEDWGPVSGDAIGLTNVKAVGTTESKTTEEVQTYTITAASPPSPGHIKLDWNKVKTVEDVVLILQELYPNTMLVLQHNSFDKLKHLAMDKQSDK